MRRDKQVIERLIERKTGKKDNYKIGLIIEGGGMRGVFGGGSMIGLEAMGLSDSFDVIYASSSGSCSGAYFLSKQTKLGTSIYYEDLPWFKFIKPWKFTKIMDLDYLIETIMRKKKKLKMINVEKSKTELKIFVANSENGACEYYTNHDGIDILKLVKASCAVPGYYNKPVDINGSKHLDGNVGKAIPIENAMTDGCTDVLVITTVPETYRETQNAVMWRWMKNILMLPLDKQFKMAYSTSRKEYNDSLDVVFGKKKVFRKINVYTISPDYRLSIGEIRPDKLKRSAEHGIFKVREAFLTEVL
jgi:predicted patatin/cPLA2 family phospholipase